MIEEDRPLAEIQSSRLEAERGRLEEVIRSLEISMVDIATQFEDVREKLIFNREVHNLVTGEILARKEQK